MPAKQEKKKISARDFLGVWSKEDAALIEKAIQESFVP
jgi:phage gpG-like protein